MSLVTVNGIRVPIAADSARLGDRVVGGDVTADDGSLHRARSAYMDVLSGATRLLSPTEALAWRGLLEGRGHRLSCDVDPDYAGTDPSAGPDQYTSRGLYLQGTVSRRGGYRNRACLIGLMRDLGFDSYFDQAIAIEASATNLLAATTRKCSDVTPFTAIGGATRSVVTTSPLEGADCLEVVAAAAGRGVSFAGSDSAVPAGTKYTLSFYARCSTGTVGVDVVFTTTDGGGSATDLITLTTTWQRFSIGSVDVSVSAAQTFNVEIYTSAGQTGTFYLDAIQIERGAFATSWVGAGSGSTDSRSGTMGLSGELTDIRRQDDVTVMGWFYGPHYMVFDESANTSDAYLWCLGDETNGVYLYRVGSSGNLRLRLITAGSTTTEITYSAADIGNSAWHHIAVVLRRAPTTGVTALQLFIDGASVGTDATAVPALGTSPNFIVGRYYGAVTNPWQGYVDELVVLPYALTADMISTVYAARFSDLPRLNVSGDYFGGVDVECLGRVTGDGLRFTGAGDATAGFQSRNAVIAFTLAQAIR